MVICVYQQSSKVFDVASFDAEFKPLSSRHIYGVRFNGKLEFTKIFNLFPFKKECIKFF